MNKSQAAFWSEDKSLNLEEVYRQRQNSLKLLVPQIASMVLTDEVAQTLKKSSVSSEFYGDRLKEVIEDALISEKEATIDKYLQEIADMKAQMAILHTEHTKQTQVVQPLLQKEADRAKQQQQQIQSLDAQINSLKSELLQKDQSFGS